MKSSGLAAAFVPEELGGFSLRYMHDWALTIATLPRAMDKLRLRSACIFRPRADWRPFMVPAKAAPHRTFGLKHSLKRLRKARCSFAQRPPSGARTIFIRYAKRVGVRRAGGSAVRSILSPYRPWQPMSRPNVRMRDADGDHIANVLFPMNTEGVCPQGDWDALGMRASGSQSVQLDGYLVPHDGLR